MNNLALKVFDNEQFGRVRTVTKDEQPWFVGVDVARALGYKKPRNAVNTKVWKQNKDVCSLYTPVVADTCVPKIGTQGREDAETCVAKIGTQGREDAETCVAKIGTQGTPVVAETTTVADEKNEEVDVDRLIRELRVNGVISTEDKIIVNEDEKGIDLDVYENGRWRTNIVLYEYD